MIRNQTKRIACIIFYAICLLIFYIYISGLYQWFLAQSFVHHYNHWGPNVSLERLVNQMQKGIYPNVKPVSEFTYPISFTFIEKCYSKDPIKVVFVVKSAIANLEQREAIRSTWGYENRFPDVIIRTIFLLGYDFENPVLQMKVEREANIHRDIILGKFKDTYFNNTLKTMMGLHWTFHHCNNTQYFAFVDDDYYVSTLNLLSFLKNPENYSKYSESKKNSVENMSQENLYAGYVFPSASPFRLYSNKWYISLKEYPYSQFPPYVTGGAYVISRKSLIDLFYASLYTNYIKIDDVFLGMAAMRVGMKLTHQPEFHVHNKYYSLEGYKSVIASHGFKDHTLLLNVWNEQRSAGNA